MLNKIIAMLTGIIGVLLIGTGLLVTPIASCGPINPGGCRYHYGNLFPWLVGGISLVALAVYYYKRWKVRDSQVV